MHFKKLELIGFKSFCDKTTLHFEPGVTAIVGPNGCGKSNIFDSIRWVLGEQSAKSLRGSEMQDVIFNGTDNKEPLSMAEVSLGFDNKDRFFNFDNDEVLITRRLFRSGESEYLLNKNVVRLKDILDLLMGTGIGAESYSIIAQGKIDLVLSSRPEDRRLVFDEASGITKYKSQKREATRKLEETEQNLLRVNDIVTEVKRQIGSLERQANKARRYKEVFEELKVKEICSSVLKRIEFMKQKDEIISGLKNLEARELELLCAIKEQEQRIANRQQELKGFEDSIMACKNEILNLENSSVRSAEHIAFNKDRIKELTEHENSLAGQIEQARSKLSFDEEKLSKVREEFDGLKKIVEDKTELLNENESQINALTNSIKASLDLIAASKKEILDLAAKSANIKNNISEFNSKSQMYLARKKRLGVEKAKVFEEKVIIEESLNKVIKEVEALNLAITQINQKISENNTNLQQQNSSLGEVKAQIDGLKTQKLTLLSHKEFLQKLKTKYEDISEAMNATIYLDKLPSENVSGLVVRVTNFSADERKLSGEAKPIELDTNRIDQRLQALEQELIALNCNEESFKIKIEELNSLSQSLHQELRNQEIGLANKETTRLTVLEQFNKIQEEEDIIILEISDVQREITVLEENLKSAQTELHSVSLEQVKAEDKITSEEANINSNSRLREEVLVIITQTKTELDNLVKRKASEETTLNMLEETAMQDREAVENLSSQINECSQKKNELEKEIIDNEENIKSANVKLEEKNLELKTHEARYLEVSAGSGDVVKKIESDRQELDKIKNGLYELQMQDKDIDYRYSTLKTRMLEAYKIDLETQEISLDGLDSAVLSQEIEQLKGKLDSYGTVNLVAIEEYDELKKRYDFLIQQQNDLLEAKESLHQAILKINRTTKQMFIETFEKVKVEFRNYFKILFGGGDAQVFLIDENDPLESGIEIICRPPGKKLQNVLLLSGGEKSMSAIALIFAIFKVKPAPFCILDEIDAALDEANVDRFSRMLQEFTQTAQFIIITHNKKTIANAGVMYGITMEQSGVSKIVSVRFAKDELKDKEPEEVAEPV